jgi:hypothetical protein
MSVMHVERVVPSGATRVIYVGVLNVDNKRPVKIIEELG